MDDLTPPHWDGDHHTDEAKALVDQIHSLFFRHPIPMQAADHIEALTAEVERLRLDVEAQEALQVSAYHAGLRAGWNFGVTDDNAGMQAAMANTDHIKELRRIREARATLAGDSHD